MTRLYDVLHEALPSDSLEDWIRGFIGERRPENEVRIFEAIADVYCEVVSECDPSLEEKKRLYFVLVMGASGYVTQNIEEGLPAGSPNFAELTSRWEQAFAANKRR